MFILWGLPAFLFGRRILYSRALTCHITGYTVHVFIKFLVGQNS